MWHPLAIPSLSNESKQPSIILPTANARLKGSSPRRPLSYAKRARPTYHQYPSHNRNPSTQLRDFSTFFSEILNEHVNYIDAIQVQNWQVVMESEITTILKNQRWKVVDWKRGIKPISAKWLFKSKHGPNRKAIKFKARIMAHSCQQTEGIDSKDIFAPMVWWSTIIMILALATMCEWSVH